MSSEDSDAANLWGNWRFGSTAAENKSTPAAQTDVFENPDILENIFSYFQRQSVSDDGESRIPYPISKYLVYASLTQKSFFEPAMNVLWRTMNSLEVVLLLIPNLVLGDGVYTTSSGEIIVKQDLVRLKLYAGRVRHFHFTSISGVISAEIFYILSKKLGGPLFPTLRTLDCGDVVRIPADRRQALFLFASPTLSEVSIHTSIDTSSPTVQFAASFFEALYETAHGITVLKVNGFSASSAFAFNLPDISERHPNSLKQLTIKDLPLAVVSSTLSRLSCITSLTVLSISLCPSGSMSYTYSSVGWKRLAFTALEVLEISGGVTDLTAMFEIGMVCPKLASLSMDIVNTSTDKLKAQGILLQYRRISYLIDVATSTSPRLRCIHVSSTDTRSTIPMYISRALFRLLSCRQLREVDVYCGFNKDMHQMLRDLCSGLSLLEVLKVSWSAHGEDTLDVFDGDNVMESRLSLIHLEDFAMPCPTLKTIHIPIFLIVTLAEFKKMRCRITEKPLNHRLAELVIRPVKGETVYSIPKNAGTISRYIDHLFPCLQVLRFEDGPAWTKDVVMRVKDYQDVRRWAKDVQVAA